MLKVHFNGFELTSIITVMPGFSLFGGADHERTFEERAYGTGSRLIKSRKGYKKISLPFFADFTDISNYDNLVRALNVDEPKRLTFSNYPGRYFEAVPINTLDFDDIKMYGTGQIDFVIQNGVALSDQPKLVTGTRSVSLTNAGTDSVYPIVRIRHFDDNGWLGITNPTGVLELGERYEVDMDYKPHQVKLVTSSKSISTVTTSTPTGDLAGGSLSVATDGKITLGAKGGWGDGTKWAGGYNVATFAGAGTGDAVYYANFKLVAETGKISQTGLLKVIFMDSQNRIVGMYEIHKSSTTKNEATFRMYYGGNSLRLFKEFKFAPSSKASENFLRSGAHGTVDFQKQGGKLRFFYFGKYYHVTVPELSEVAISKVGIFIGQYGTRDLVTDHYFTHLAVKSFYCDRINLDVQNGVKNDFRAGDVVEINMGSGEITVNGKERNDLLVTGSSFLNLPLGTSELQVAMSKWVPQSTRMIGTQDGQQPEIEVEYRERWL